MNKKIPIRIYKNRIITRGKMDRETQIQTYRKRRERFLFSVLLFTIVIFVWFLNEQLPGIFLDIGRDYYNQTNYVEAYKNLKRAYQLNPKNKDIRYYYVQTLVYLKPTQEVQKELFAISQSNLSDSASLVADRQILKWRNQIFLHSGENYIEQVPYNGEILRWDTTKFPLSVYFKNTSSAVPSYYESYIKKAFLDWQIATKRLVNFRITSDEKDANIDIIIKSSTEMKKCSQEDCKYTVAYTTPTISGNLLDKMTIYFYDSDNSGHHFSEQEIYNTALHEIGHTLGIMGHSYNKNDVLYMETKQDNRFSNVPTNVQTLSYADINTINLLYKLIPNITNTGLNAFDTRHQFFAPIVLGSDEQINSRKLIEAQNYIKSAPNLPNGYIDLATAYAELKQYNNAFEALNTALQYASNDNERHIIYYNFAVIYMEINDYNNAFTYANMAKQLNPSADIDGMLALINYKLGYKDTAIKMYKSVLSKNPDSTIDACNLAVIYVKSLNLPQAGKVLNKLIKANPDAINDPKVRAFGGLIFLFK